LVRGGTIIDGTGAPGYCADLRVCGGRIAEIGPSLKAGGETVLDATGAVVTPGIIDPHTHYEATMFWDPACDLITLHGVTSVLMEKCRRGWRPHAPETGLPRDNQDENRIASPTDVPEWLGHCLT
jgi:N-acyl-D-amino-acid deacylase